MANHGVQRCLVSWMISIKFGEHSGKPVVQARLTKDMTAFW